LKVKNQESTSPLRCPPRLGIRSLPFPFLYQRDNNLPDSVKGKVRLFADDTVVYLTIRSEQDAQTLQDDLHALEIWEKNWSMKFNPDKCEVLRITRKRNPVIFP
jgi:hypothetical protein